jgi:hypothetical protein
MTAPFIKTEAKVVIAVHARSKTESAKATMEAMKQLIRAAAQDKRLIEDKDWQDAMTYVNRLVSKQTGYRPNEYQRRIEDVTWPNR